MWTTAVLIMFIHNNLMFYVKFVLLAAMLLTVACGGGGVGDFDEFQPRAATAADFSAKTFEFTWLPDSNPLHPDLGEMTITFGAADGSGQGEFSVQEHGAGSATGTYQFTSPNSG
jgi:hypothetical protein